MKPSNRVYEAYLTPIMNQSFSAFQGKAIPVQAWTGPEDSRRLRLPDFKTIGDEGGKVVSSTHRPP
jgi:hypothetical protein